MKRKLLHRGLAFFSVLAVSLSLAACSVFQANGVASSKNPVPASKAFNSKTIWYTYRGDDTAGKDTSIDQILVFDGKGKVTAYHCDDLTFADLKDLKDNEVIDLAKEQDKAVFDKEKQDVLDGYQYNIDTLTEKRDDLKKEYDNKNYKSAAPYVGVSKDDPTAAQKYKKWYENYFHYFEVGLDFRNEVKSKIEAIEYKEPEPVEFKLSATTDKAGNAVSKETLSFSDRSYFTSMAYIPVNCSAARYPGLGSLDKNADTLTVDKLMDSAKAEFEKTSYFKNEGTEFTWDMLGYYKNDFSKDLNPWIPKQSIYSKYYGGYMGLVTQVNEMQGGFILDAADTKGIEFDK